MEGIGKIYLENGGIECAMCEQEEFSLIFRTYEGHKVLELTDDEIIRILNSFGGYSKWIKSNLTDEG